MDYLEPLQSDLYTFITRVPERNDLWDCLTVLHWQVWMSFAASIVGFAGLLWFVHHISLTEECLDPMSALEHSVRSACLQGNVLSFLTFGTILEFLNTFKTF